MKNINKASAIVGRRMKEAREARGWTLSQMQIQSGIGAKTIAHYEVSGFTGNMDKLADIHKALGLPMWSLLPTEEELRRGI